MKKWGPNRSKWFSICSLECQGILILVRPLEVWRSRIGTIKATAPPGSSKCLGKLKTDQPKRVRSLIYTSINLKKETIPKSLSKLQITATPSSGFHVHDICSCTWLYVVRAPFIAAFLLTCRSWTRGQKWSSAHLARSPTTASGHQTAVIKSMLCGLPAFLDLTNAINSS